MSLLHPAPRTTDRRPLALMIALAVALTFWQHQAWRRGSISLPEFLAFHAVTPLESGLSFIAGKLEATALAVAAAPRLAEENRRLRMECDELEAERISDAETREELKGLRRKIGLEPGKPYDRLAAWVIGRSSGTQSCWVKIRAERGKPLEVGNVVREAGGLVGRVTEASGDTARAVLLTDPGHAVRGKDLRTGDEGMVHAAPELAAGRSRLRLEKARAGARIMAGDIIVTSELGETYPGGVPIGIVETVRRSPTNVSSIVAYIKPLVDFDHLDYVYVLRAGEKG
jgi:rod shape-determining protein MreC